jgi:hypothetical protein
MRPTQTMPPQLKDQLEWGKMWKLLEFGEKLEKLLQVVTPPEVAFQKDCSAPEVTDEPLPLR